MKKYLPIVLISATSISAMAWNVGTEPTSKSVVIEEFTGIHCGNCPDGHKRATMLHHAHPEDIYLVSIHAGTFAEPSRSEPNYITEAGKAIHDYFEINSYPCGTTSRRDAGKGLVQGRGDWGASARTITRETSPVNLWAGCEYDAATRKLDVTVEGYFTGEMSDPRLTVEILQYNILGPQSGGLLGNEYPHRHVLRMMLNEDAFGEPLEFPGIGEYISKSWSVELPADVDGVTLTDSDIEILAFISEGQGEIMKAAACFPTIDADKAATRIIVQSDPLIAVGNNYALGYAEVYLDNYSCETLTEAKFEVKINGNVEEMTWNGSIPAHGCGLVKVPFPQGWESIIDNDDNSLSVKMLTANGRPAALETFAIKSNFSKVSEYPSELTVKITTDTDAADNTYRIIDSEGETVAEFGPYPDGSQTAYEEHVSLEAGKVYGFEVTDAWGDGIYHPRGSVKFYKPNGKIASQLMEIDGYGLRTFFRTTDTSGITGIESDEETAEYYDLTGRRLSEPGRGLTIKVTREGDGTLRSAQKEIR